MTNLMNKYEMEIQQLQGEIDSHAFHWMVGFRWNDASNYQYRLTRENEIKDLRKKLAEEKRREQVVSHAVQNAELKESGVDTSNLGEKKEGWDAFTSGLNDVASIATKPIRDVMTTAGAVETPIINRVADSVDNTVNKTGDVLIGGENAIGNIFSSPIVIVGGIAAAVYFGPKLLKI